MNIIIGVDTHIATCDYFAVNQNGEILGEGSFDTSATGFRKMLSSIKGEGKALVIEQGPLANWIRRIVAPHVSTVAVAEPRRNRWIAKDNVKNDRFDAEKLATLYRGGFIKDIVPRNDQNQHLFHLVIQHHSLTRQLVCIKNKIKAKYRENGIRAAGTTVYKAVHRDFWQGQLSTNKHLGYAVKLYYQQYDLLTEQIEEIDKELGKISKQYTIIKTLMDMFPGIGLISACTFIVLIDTPPVSDSEKSMDLLRSWFRRARIWFENRVTPPHPTWKSAAKVYFETGNPDRC